MRASTTKLTRPIATRKTPDTAVPIRPMADWSVDESSSTWPTSERTPKASRRHSPKTTLEWPSENQNPTDTGRCPAAVSRRVVLSIAAMWSASNACRIPSVYAVSPRPTPNPPDAPRL